MKRALFLTMSVVAILSTPVSATTITDSLTDNVGYIHYPPGDDVCDYFPWLCPPVPWPGPPVPWPWPLFDSLHSAPA